MTQKHLERAKDLLTMTVEKASLALGAIRTTEGGAEADAVVSQISLAIALNNQKN
jgi:hypothetical protein